MTAYPFTLGPHYQAVLTDAFRKEFTITNQDGQPEDETITLPNGKVYKRTFTYTLVSGLRAQILRSEWVEQ